MPGPIGAVMAGIVVVLVIFEGGLLAYLWLRWPGDHDRPD
jgi:hypothetical protein